MGIQSFLITSTIFPIACVLFGPISEVMEPAHSPPTVHSDEERQTKRARIHNEMFQIPEETIGVVIGKGGSKIKEIKSNTGVGVILGSRDSAVDGMINVTLRGNKEGCDDAKQIILDLISKLTEMFQIPEDTIGVVIGKGGSKIKEIKSNTRVDVFLGSRDSAVDGMITVTLRGKKEGCDDAKKIIMDLICEPTDVFEIPEEKVGVVIGKQGSKIQEIREFFGVGVYVGPMDSAVDGRNVSLRGNKEDRDKAKVYIMDLISDLCELEESDGWISDGACSDL